ncbi:MAG: DUF4335 domain-containing protein [Nodosilinea sp. WJT8-NPBG4]|jgi:hypothetical protein|nr:DUF4335 domain-containing protein [Nodosilinea sp. WJT8-NPBG4]
MTVQRQYTLPHCNLVLEGLSADANDPLSPLAVLMNAECHLPGATDATLSGGREFLDSLVAAVSRYGQQLLSGVPYPRATGSAPPMVEIKPGDLPYHHHLIVQQQPLGDRVNDVNALPPLDIQLTTVQFYDLMEAVDQLLADTQTLPDMKAQFQAVSRRLVRPTEPMTKRATPAALGAAALAAAGLALFFVPPPEFEPTRPESEASAPAAASAVPGEPPRTDGETSEAVAADGDSLDRLESAPAITDAATIALLQSDVTQRLQEAWADVPRPSGDLAYRMAVSEDGDILGYQYENDLALEEVDNTPLPQLTFVPVAGAEPVRERVAQFVATFTPDGEVRLEPTETPAETEEPETNASETDTSKAGTSEADAAELPTLEDKVTDSDRIRELNSDLYDSILAELEPLSANEDLRFRVRLTETGEVVGYEPVNAAAGLLVNETPLPNLVTTADSTANQADFQVVFTESGVLEVNPWDGWPQ